MTRGDRGVEVQLCSVLISGLDASGWSTPRPRPLYLRERTPVPIVEEAHGPQSRSGRVWNENRKPLAPSGVRKPGFAARNVTAMSTTLFHPRSQSTENETCVSAHIRMSMASNQGRCGEKMESNRLNYGTAGCSTSSGRKTKTLYSPRPSHILFSKAAINTNWVQSYVRMKNEQLWEKCRRLPVVTQFDTVSRHFAGRTNHNHVNRQSRQTMSGLTTEPRPTQKDTSTSVLSSPPRRYMQRTLFIHLLF
jgi:hypothetical protein